MSEEELQRILSYLKVLKQLQADYGHKTLNNVVKGFEARVQYHKDVINKRRYNE